MIRINTILLIAATLVGGLSIGCGDDDDDKGGGGDASKCTKANKILSDCGADDDEQLSSSCVAEEQKFADCVIKYPAGACDEEGESSESNAFFSCVIGQ
jgi:hypothetical protein